MLTGSTVLNDATTAQYIHTLTVTGRLGGLYTCTVANVQGSAPSAFTVEGINCACVFHVMTVPMLAQNSCRCEL